MTHMNARPARATVAFTIALAALSLQLLSGRSLGADAGIRCGTGEFWDNFMSMCMPQTSPQSRGFVFGGQFNAFAVFSALQGPRGVNQFAAPNMFMLDAGRGIGTKQFLDLDLMGTTEVWTYPRHGYPELLQIGEERGDGTPYIDAQHPHTSPVMGLTLSDTLTWADHQSLKLSFAPPP